MHCPFCETDETKVIDSRLMSSGNQIRRRRECLECHERFTTYEVAELMMPRVIKADQSRVPFDEEKLRNGMLKALEKRPVNIEQIESAIHHILRQLRATGEREVSSELVGSKVMDALRQLDKVAYVRFASVYRSFEDVNAFREEIKKLEQHEEQLQMQQENDYESESP